MHLKNDGLTVGELSITIATLIIIGFIWTNITKEKGTQEISRVLSNSSETKLSKTFMEIKYFN